MSVLCRMSRTLSNFFLQLLFGIGHGSIIIIITPHKVIIYLSSACIHCLSFVCFSLLNLFWFTSKPGWWLHGFNGWHANFYFYLTLHFFTFLFEKVNKNYLHGAFPGTRVKVLIKISSRLLISPRLWSMIVYLIFLIQLFMRFSFCFISFLQFTSYEKVKSSQWFKILIFLLKAF